MSRTDDPVLEPEDSEIDYIIIVGIRRITYLLIG